MKFTLMGGHGFIGTHMTAHLKKIGHEVVVPPKGRELDYHESLGAVIYLIGLTGNFRSRPFDTVYAHTTRLADILKQARFESFLYVSTTRLYEGNSSDPVDEDSPLLIRPIGDSVYNTSKLTGECLCLSLNNPSIRIARLSNVIGVDMSPSLFVGSLLSDIQARRSIEIGESPVSSKDYVGVENVCWALENIALNGKSQLYNVASGVQTNHQQIANLISKSTAMRVGFAPNGVRRVFPKISIQRIQQDLGYQPSSFETTFRKLLNDAEKAQR
jgi:nucleoside-diphosphate-sugar epimerase